MSELVGLWCSHTDQMLLLVPLIVLTFRLSLEVCLTYIYDAASSISLHFQSLFLPCCFLFTPAVFLSFFFFSIFIMWLLMCVCVCVCATSELISGKCVQMCVHLAMQIIHGCLKFTDCGKEAVISKSYKLPYGFDTGGSTSCTSISSFY